jgi:hypothetical protein
MSVDKTSPAEVFIESGTCHVFFAHDVGLSIDLDEAERRLEDPKYRKSIQRKRNAPEYFQYDPPPLRIARTIEPFGVAEYAVSGTVETTIYDFGAVSVAYQIPLRGAFDALLGLGGALTDNAMLLKDARGRVEELLRVIGPAVSKPRVSGIVEDYAIYQIDETSPRIPPEALIRAAPDRLAGLLRGDVEPLSEQEILDALHGQLSYGTGDLVIVDWNAALLFDVEPDDVRAVLEYANVELLEMRYLDGQLDKALEESYRVLTERTWTRGLLFGSPRRDLRRVAELQVDAALMFEGVNNAIKLLGDQYLARVYRRASERLHLTEWDASIVRKLQILESIYNKMSDHHSHLRMEVLEWIIIILIAVSIAVSLLPGVGH